MANRNLQSWEIAKLQLHRHASIGISNEPVAPGIGGSDLPETTLKALANPQLEEWERRRSDRKWLISNIASWVIAVIGWGVAVYIVLAK